MPHRPKTLERPGRRPERRFIGRIGRYFRLGQVMQQAAVLQASGVLGKHASSNAWPAITR